MSENRSALIVEGNPTATGRVLIEHPCLPRALTLSTAKARSTLRGKDSALTRKSAKRLDLSVSN